MEIFFYILIGLGFAQILAGVSALVKDNLYLTAMFWPVILLTMIVVYLLANLRTLLYWAGIGED